MQFSFDFFSINITVLGLPYPNDWVRVPDE
jgi:hypothetical protein